MFKTLLKSRFTAWGVSMFAGNKKGKTRTKGATIALAIMFCVLVLFLIFSLSIMFYGIAELSLYTGEVYAMLTIASIVAVALCIVGSIFATKTQIFDSKDNEFLLSMPIPPNYIFLSRLVLLLLVNYGLEALVMLPAIIIHAVIIGFSPIGAIFAFLIFILIPFFTLSLSALCAWGVSIIASKIKNKTLVTTVLFVVIMTVYLLGCGSLGVLFGSFEEGTVSFAGLKNTAIFYWMASAASLGNYLNFIIFALICIALALSTYLLLNHFFISIITTHKGAPVAKIKSKEEKVNSVKTALFKKEIRRFFTSSAYILNAGIGNLLGVLFSVILALNSQEFLQIAQSEPVISKLIPVFVLLVSMFFFSMNIVSAPSISLENNNLWILQSAPIRARDVLMAKVKTHITISTPCALVGTLILVISYKIDALVSVLILLANLSLVVFTAFFGMLLGLKFPKFDWLNENVAVKQGFAVFGALMGGMLWSVILIAVAFLFTVLVNIILAAITVIILNLIMCLPIYLYFNGKAEKTFKLLKQ
ncbi:MAG: hypothetical protein IJZ93_01170 [Clostridia bacterium]|nr:hypothetical protein [Clostridia bacterium]